MSSPLDQQLPANLAPDRVDGDTSGLSLLLANLHVTLTFLDKRDTLRSAAGLVAVQRHARQTYDEAIGLLPLLTISDADRTRIEARIEALRERLIRLGEEIQSRRAG